MKIYFATGNSGKVENADQVLGDDFEVEQLDIETVEPSRDLEKIAKAKVEQAREKAEIEGETFLIADDSGLFINSLNGFPGPQTSFFDEKVGKDNILKLIEEDNMAEFRSAVALALPGEETEVFTGKVEGEIVEPRGNGGFGYDPLFLPESSDETWGEEPGQKNRESHRKKALEKLREFMKKNF